MHDRSAHVLLSMSTKTMFSSFLLILVNKMNKKSRERTAEPKLAGLQLLYG